MDKQGFLNTVVFGYIKKDLENIKSYLPKNPGEQGNNNFTIALCVLSYIEYLGSFFTLKDKDNLEGNIKVYIETCFKNPTDYHSAILGELFRNGLSHDYFARGGVGRDNIRPGLYRNYDKRAVLDSDTLLDDFLDSLDKFRNNLPDDKYTQRMKLALDRIKELEGKYASEINKLPFIGNLSNAHTSGSTVPPASITLPYDSKEK